MNVIEVIAPAIEPITLEQMRLELRQDITTTDAEIERQIVAAREAVEQYTNRSFIQRRLRMITDVLPAYWGGFCGCWHRDRAYSQNYVELVRSPVVSVALVEYRNTSDGSLTTVDPSAYWVDTDSLPSRLYFTSYPWPVNQPLRIEYVAGYPSSEGSPGDDGLAAIPKQVVQSIVYRVKCMYDEMPPDKREAMSNAADAIVNSLVVHTL